ncbi:MAG: glycosyltransferase family 2 protein [Actinomycetota bacterium]
MSPDLPADAPDAGAPRPGFSVVVPVYNSERSLEELYDRLAATFTGMEQNFEVVFVDDGSRDGSLAVLRSLHAAHPERVRVLSLYRNQGQQVALMCGFQYCTGDLVVTIDDDLQQSPEDIPVLCEKLRQGYDAVFGSYQKKAHGFLQNLGSRLVRRLVQRIFGPPQGLEMSSFRLIRSDVVEHVKAYRTSFPYLSGMILSTTHLVANAEVRHDERRYGRSGYTLPKLVRLSFNLLVNYSALPLKAIGWVGMGASLLAFVAGAVFMARQLLVGRAPAGWTSLAVLVSFFSGAIFAMMFVMAEYLSRLLTEVSNRPPHAVREILE